MGAAYLFPRWKLYSLVQIAKKQSTTVTVLYEVLRAMLSVYPGFCMTEAMSRTLRRLSQHQLTSYVT